MRKLLTGCVILFLCNGAFADYRIWLDRDGNEIEAEFVRELFDKVTLRKKDGSEVRMAVDEFSELDQKFLRVKVPPQIDVEVKHSDWIWEEPAGGDGRDNPITCHKVTVRVEKKSKRPYTSRLYAEIYFIAEEVPEGDNMILAWEEEFDFIFPEGSRSSSYIFKTKEFRTATDSLYENARTSGETYAGYILVVRDVEGVELLHKTNVKGKWADDPEVIKNLKDLWMRGRASIRSRHFDKKTGKKVKVPRTPDYSTPYY